MQEQSPYESPYMPRLRSFNTSEPWLFKGNLRVNGGKNVEATTGFEPVMEVLQTSALPLGHVAGLGRGAEDEIRTRDPLLGKEVLYR
jgi:hypothetical protein